MIILFISLIYLISLTSSLVIFEARSPAEIFIPGGEIIKDSILLPQYHLTKTIPKFLNNISRTCKIIVYCRSGRRSGIVINKLKALGFTNLHNGINLNNMKKNNYKAIKYPFNNDKRISINYFKNNPNNSLESYYNNKDINNEIIKQFKDKCQ